MGWNNESVFEFIDLIRGEPDIWDPRRNGHKNRNNIIDAWNRIKDKFSLPCSIEELKRKRNTLLTQYRDCLKKIKDSRKTSSAEDIYKPAWFAFEALHNFMGDVYEYRVTIVSEAMKEERPESRESGSIETSSRPESRDSNSLSGADAFPTAKRRRGMQDILHVEMDEGLSRIKNRRNSRENEKEVNACELFGQLLAEKLKPLDTDDRLVLMNEIDNLVFKYTMNVRQRI